MTINTNDTTAACSGGEPSVDLMQRVWANLYFNESDAGNTFQETLNEVVDWLAARGALPDHDKPYEPQASAPRSASAGDGVREALKFYASEWQANGDGDSETPGLSRSWVGPTDELQKDGGRKARQALSISAPPTIRTDQDVGIRERLIAAGCTSPDGSYIHESTESVLAAISADTTAGATTRTSIIQECANVVGEMRQSEAGIFDAAHSGQRGEDRSNALYDAYQAIRALASNPLEGKVAK